MRLYDWLLDRSRVSVTVREGEVYATDRRSLIIASDVVDKPETLPGESGIYEVTKTRYRKIGQDPDAKPDEDLSRLISEFNSNWEKWSLVSPTPWVHVAHDQLSCRVYTMRQSQPVYIDEAFARCLLGPNLYHRTPLYELYGTDPDKPMLIKHRITWRWVGLIRPTVMTHVVGGFIAEMYTSD